MPEQDIAALEEVFSHNPKAFLAAASQAAEKHNIDVRVLYGYLFTCLAVRAHDEYQKQGISDTVYYDTMHDLDIWAENCHSISGVWGISEVEWLSLHVSLKLFCLGRLQFQPMTFTRHLTEISEAASEVPIAEGAAVLNVHISRGTKLSPEACEEAYCAAAEFFKQEHPTFVCCSWFLHSSLKELLPPNSNLLAFQRRYHVFGERSGDADSKHVEQIIFGTAKSDPRGYAQNTKLQKNAVAYLKAGKRLGEGFGYFIL